MFYVFDAQNNVKAPWLPTHGGYQRYTNGQYYYHCDTVLCSSSVFTRDDLRHVCCFCRLTGRWHLTKSRNHRRRLMVVFTGSAFLLVTFIHLTWSWASHQSQVNRQSLVKFPLVCEQELSAIPLTESTLFFCSTCPYNLGLFLITSPITSTSIFFSVLHSAVCHWVMRHTFISSSSSHQLSIFVSWSDLMALVSFICNSTFWHMPCTPGPSSLGEGVRISSRSVRFSPICSVFLFQFLSLGIL